MDVSQRLLTKLEESTQGKEFDVQVIGMDGIFISVRDM